MNNTVNWAIQDLEIITERRQFLDMDNTIGPENFGILKALEKDFYNSRTWKTRGQATIWTMSEPG
jgi:hypothetical protein